MALWRHSTLAPDDYLQKPFRPRELLARLRALLRRSDSSLTVGPVINAADLTIDLSRRVALRRKREIEMTRTEFEILAVLARRLDQVVSSESLLTKVWGPRHGDYVQTLRVHIGHLRRKIEPKPLEPVYLLTERGVGYRLTTPPKRVAQASVPFYPTAVPHLKDRPDAADGSQSPLAAMQDVNPTSPWFAVQVKHNHEKAVSSLLRRQGLEEFLPLYRSRRRWSDRSKMIELPLFPGYLFCRFNPDSRTPVLRTPGVIRIVGAGGRSIPVDDAELTAIRAVVTSRLNAEPCSFLKQGQVVRIEEGPLAGLEGVVGSWKGSDRLIVSVTLLQRSVAVELDPRLLAAGEKAAPLRQCSLRTLSSGAFDPAG